MSKVKFTFWLVATYAVLFVFIKNIPLTAEDCNRVPIFNEGLGEIINRAVWFFLNHTSRSGNIYSLFLAEESTALYSAVAAFCFMWLNTVLFILGAGRLPKGETRDAFVLLLISGYLFTALGHIPGRTMWNITGGSNYLIPHTILFTFLALYGLLINEKMYFADKAKSTIFLFIFGVFAGWTTESAPPASGILILYTFYVYHYKLKRPLPKWFYSGAAGLLSGWLIIMLGPGNKARAVAEGITLFGGDIVLNFFRATWITFQAFIRYRPIELMLFLAILAPALLIYRREKSKSWTAGVTTTTSQKAINKALILLVCCWFSDMAYTFALGVPAEKDVRLAGTLFIVAGMAAMSDYAKRYFSENRRMHVFPIFIAAIFAIIATHNYVQSFKIKQQGDYRLQLMKSPGEGTAVIPGFTRDVYFLSRLHNMICSSQDKLVSNWLGGKTGVVDVKPGDFFTTKYNTAEHYFAAYKIAGSADLGPNFVEEVRWLPLDEEVNPAFGKVYGKLYIRLRGGELYNSALVWNPTKWSLPFIEWALDHGLLNKTFSRILMGDFYRIEDDADRPEKFEYVTFTIEGDIVLTSAIDNKTRIIIIMADSNEPRRVKLTRGNVIIINMTNKNYSASVK